jgi:hypothetical protein
LSGEIEGRGETVRTSTETVTSLITRIDKGDIRLPEIQRGYIWKPSAVAGLIDSLYRRYPSGSLLLWEADEAIRERKAAIVGGDDAPLIKPLYLLDGQQRLTSLHRAWHGHERAIVAFNVQDQRFQIESAATRTDPRWVQVHPIVRGEHDLYDAVETIVERIPELPRKEVYSRLDRIRKIGDYTYYLEIVESMPYEEVTDIFVRVNSRGRPLRATDLALATLSARWPGVVDRISELHDDCTKQAYPDLDATFLTRCLAASISDTASPKVFATAPTETLEAAWGRVRFGVDHLIKLLKGTLRIDSSALIPSVNALVPLVAFLGARKGEQLGEDTRDQLVYWLLGAWVHARFSGSSQTVIAQDVAAVRSDEPLKRLYANLGLVGQRLVVTDAMLAGRGSTSPYFFLSYLVARHADANDWWHAVPVAATHDGNFKVEYHHIHPQATIKNEFSKAEVNDLANLAFISSRANKKISARRPVDYFPEIGETELTRHSIPLDLGLRTPERYVGFVRERRRLLAEGMTRLLDAYRPAWLDDTSTPIADATAGEKLVFDLYGTSPTSDDLIWVAHATIDGNAWTGAFRHEALLRLLEDIEAGRGGEFDVGGETVNIDVGADEIVLPFGPLEVRGSLEEWRKVVDRELLELRLPTQLPTVPEPLRWESKRSRFPVLDSE